MCPLPQIPGEDSHHDVYAGRDFSPKLDSLPMLSPQTAGVNAWGLVTPALMFREVLLPAASVRIGSVKYWGTPVTSCAYLEHCP